MKLNKIMMAAFLVFGSVSVAQAADEGHGSVTFTGSIIEAPCSILPGDIDQTVNLGQVSNVALEKGGTSKPQNFEISLQGCTLSTKKSVTTTFTGMASPSGNGLLAMTGTAKGASIGITNSDGSVVKLNEKSKPQLLQNGNNTLSYAAYLQGDVKGTGEGAVDPKIVPGEFKSVANFTLAYE
ncbi:Fimbria A protein precursor [Serratia proteamaculans]|jgi:type 1 fimbria pilin|uniref:fimbrial protein n=1 Tax=Serratia proteamaculans TaxID=28151 RepID=UPI00217A7140|nr:fimbrial protein [Serratia proteamaculans]CAI1114522.1 Fimbria A protein precursor [Serratia proteamaculans]